MTSFRYAIVVGASSGIGEALARALVKRGTRVALLARRLDRLQQICEELNQNGYQLAIPYAHDVHDTASVPALFQQIARDLGGIDLVIYASGIMPAIRWNEYPTELDADVVAVNLVGAMAWLNEAALRFAQMKQGTIIGISSVAGDRGRRQVPVYGTTKAALTTYLEALRNRLSVQGVHVLTVKPGYVRTEMTGDFKPPAFLPIISADRAAHEILAAADNNHQTIYVPGVWRTIMWLIRSIPSPLFRRLNV